MFKVKLSKVQKDVVDALKLGLFLWTDEGESYKAWLGDSRGRVHKKIHRSTARSLFDKGLLKLVDGDYRSNWYKYKLNEEEIKNEIF